MPGLSGYGGATEPPRGERQRSWSTHHPPGQAQELTEGIRQHWHVKSDNWIRDVTLDEDQVKTKSSNQAQVMGCLRSLAMRLLRYFKVPNFQEALEDLADCPSRFEAFLRRVKFL